MSVEIRVDIAIVGAGIAGAGLAAELAGDFSVALIEQEERPAFHSTGRSAAIFIQNYGNAVIRALTRASLALYLERDLALYPEPLLKPRGLLYVAGEEGLARHAELLAGAEGMRELSPDEALRMVPALKRGWLKAAAYEPDAQDIDVAALHQGFLRKAKSGGATLLARAPLRRAERRAGFWRIDTESGVVQAKILADAAGAWADTVAAASGVAPLGIRPMRRSIAVLPVPDGMDISRWPLVADSGEGWYAKPEAGKLLVSPADEDPVDPHDAYPDDMVLAEGLYRFEQAVDFPVTRVERSWAGLRSFAPDRTPVVGFDPAADDFFWLAGQGGYGIQTAPALSRLAGLLLRRATVAGELEPIAAQLSPARFRRT